MLIPLLSAQFILFGGISFRVDVAPAHELSSPKKAVAVNATGCMPNIFGGIWPLKLRINHHKSIIIPDLWQVEWGKWCSPTTGPLENDVPLFVFDKSISFYVSIGWPCWEDLQDILGKWIVFDHQRWTFPDVSWWTFPDVSWRFFLKINPMNVRLPVVFWGSGEMPWSQVCNRFAAALAILCALVREPGDLMHGAR